MKLHEGCRKKADHGRGDVFELNRGGKTGGQGENWRGACDNLFEETTRGGGIGYKRRKMVSDFR